ncbi:MAG: amidohydrolase, partial [Bacteroidota bacterium]
IQDRVGTLETGKDATLFVSAGDALDFRTNKLSDAFIGGRRLVLPGKHEDLYKRYSLKYGHVKE